MDGTHFMPHTVHNYHHLSSMIEKADNESRLVYKKSDSTIDAKVGQIFGSAKAL